MTMTKRTIFTMTMISAGIMTANQALAQSDGPPDEVTTWVLQPAFDSSDAGWDNGLIPWIEAVEEATEGTVKIELRPAGSLTSGDEALMAAASGMTDGYAGWATVYGGDLPEGMLAFGLPMGAESPEEAWEVMWGEDYRVGDLVQEAAHESGLHWVGWTDQGTNAMFTNFRVEKLEDLKGKKMRAGGPQALFHEALGGTAVSMGAGDIYTAIRLGTIDGTYWDTGGIDDMSFNEVVDYAIQPGWNPAQHQETFVNLEAWNALTDWQREQINSVFKETYFETSKMHAEQVDIALQSLRDEGGEVINFSDEEIDRMREFSIEEVWPEIAAMSERNAEGVEIFKRFMKDKGKL
ncbi:TRAP transporter substrate-binding protein DctP [Halomonas sp. 18H]|uniref:TRAP transporter substrate-binding protein n=1 Tax=Halomonas almeriensis TaxID=308163 RepID=UPI002232A423|nr:MULTISPECIES: TRAP transporter substrate-binding protein DctP [Halomonas]MCW4149215.1 TRAP transporter substrate-binding protein DctP [Halomonas sp. 18H]MDN3552235.1 TRAP transporter substrate-binding protein DctP [Halomonas almeriensis]